MSIVRTIGPNSDGIRLRNLDGRTELARFMKNVRAELSDAMGGNPAPGQRLLLDLVVVKAGRLRMLSGQLLADTLPAEECERRFIWHSNSLRRDLASLGLDRPSAPPSETLSDFLQGAA